MERKRGKWLLLLDQTYCGQQGKRTENTFSTAHRGRRQKLSLSAAEIVELYDLRWQIELFFKELKSTLGFHPYRFEKFTCVERWVEMCLVTFLYLEWYRVRRRKRPGQPAKEKRWWLAQRTHGLAMAVRQAVDCHDLSTMARLTATKAGLRKLRAILYQALPLEFRMTP